MSTQELTKQESSLSLSQRMKIKKNSPVLLLDTSSSMTAYLEGETRRIDALRSIVSSLKVTGAIYSFNDRCSPCLKDAIPTPAGGTMMSQAFNYLKSQGHKKVIMITDGEALDKGAALSSVVGLELQVMYVGTGEVPDFLNQLVTASGGSFCTKEDLTLPKELGEKIQLLLEAGKQDAGGTICL